MYVALFKLLCVDMGKHPANTNNIFLLQKRLIRIVIGARQLDRRNKFFQQLHELKFPDIVKLKTFSFTGYLHRVLVICHQIFSVWLQDGK